MLLYVARLLSVPVASGTHRKPHRVRWSLAFVLVGAVVSLHIGT